MKRLNFGLTIIVALFSISVAYAQTEEPPQEKKEVTYSEIRQMIDEGVLVGGTVSGDGWWVTVKKTDGSVYYAPVTPYTPIADRLIDAGVPTKIVHISNENDNDLPLWLELLINGSPLVIFIVFFVFILWATQRKGKKEQDKCMNRAEAINNAFLEKQEAQFKSFINDLASVMNEKNG